MTIAVTFTAEVGRDGRESVLFEGFAEQGHGAVAIVWPEVIRDSFVRAFAKWRTDPEQRHDIIEQVASVTACSYEGDRYRYMMTLQYRRRRRLAEEPPVPRPPAPVNEAHVA